MRPLGAGTTRSRGPHTCGPTTARVQILTTARRAPSPASWGGPSPGRRLERMQPVRRAQRPQLSCLDPDPQVLWGNKCVLLKKEKEKKG